MFFDDFPPWRCKNVVNTSVFSSKGIKMVLDTVFLDVFGPKYLTGSNNNNNNKNNKKNIWHLVSLVRADPAAERREYKKRSLSTHTRCKFLVKEVTHVPMTHFLSVVSFCFQNSWQEWRWTSMPQLVFFHSVFEGSNGLLESPGTKKAVPWALKSVTMTVPEIWHKRKHNYHNFWGWGTCK